MLVDVPFGQIEGIRASFPEPLDHRVPVLRAIGKGGQQQQVEVSLERLSSHTKQRYTKIY